MLAFCPDSQPSPRPALLWQPPLARRGGMRTRVLPREGRVTGRGDAKSGLFARSTCSRLACYGLVLKLDPACLPGVSRPGRKPPSVLPEPALPRYAPPTSPAYKTPAWPSPVTYPQSGLPHRSLVGSGRGSGQGQSPDSPEGCTVGMTKKKKKDGYLYGDFPPRKRWMIHLSTFLSIAPGSTLRNLTRSPLCS